MDTWRFWEPVLLYTTLYMSVVAIIVTPFLWYFDRRERKIDEFVKRHFHL